ncbi:CIA30 family protein [Aequorivita sp. CIP111184]|uniref:CIA30 family protein n=1 Tax=Aequorivita sp. CIP111184 TaxID=2211356 RepID=UPI000DD0CF7D|nr:CIA30 family protein [Aequorivita sp. CIP111184]
MQTTTIFDFNKTIKTNDWNVVDDVVMGGKSSGTFYVNKEGNGVFEGRVSLENNGGFSSLRYRFNKITTKQYAKIVLRIKGDGKAYQFRIKNKSSNYYSYIAYFDTTKNWETIELNLSDMYPTFRGQKVNMPNYDNESIEEIAFLIGNKMAEDFKLEIDSIVLK